MEYEVKTKIIDGTKIIIRKPIVTEERRAECQKEVERRLIALYESILEDKEKS